MISLIISNLTEFKRESVKNCIKLLEEGATIPFIARYRKEMTGGLDEVSIQKIRDRYNYFKELEERKRVIINKIREAGKLTNDISEKIKNCRDKRELEDIYLPFKPKRKSRAQIAREMGLLPLSKQILSHEGDDIEIKEIVRPYLNPKKNVKSIEDAIKGAMDIISEIYSETPEIRKFVRFAYLKDGIIKSKVREEFKDKKTKYVDYYDFSEKISQIPSHRFLAIKRGEREKVLSISISADDDLIFEITKKFFIKNKKTPFLNLIEESIKRGYKRLLLPSIKIDVMVEAKRKADIESIAIFERNLKSILLAPPFGNKTVMGIDPGYRTGCKIAVIDKTGKFLENDTIFPTPPFKKMEESEEKILKLIKKHGVEGIAIGNGTASKETYLFIKEVIRKNRLNVSYKVISKAGASVYSASEIAREEFPNLDLTVRGAISIGRRFQDPLSELVKIDPASIGVGQYQHDVNQRLLKNKLKEVVEFCVNRVGVDLNTASFHLLSYVSGITKSLSKKIVEYRFKNGTFKNRSELLNIPGFGEKTFKLSAGFLRIKGGENPLDMTMVHPESYFIVEKICKKLNKNVNQLMGNEKLLKETNLEELLDEEMGSFTIKDIIEELKKNGRDIRGESKSFEFNHNFSSIEDLSEGMILSGIITNITNFGLFVDIGVHQDGLIHRSNLKDGHIKNLTEIYQIGEEVKVKIKEIDLSLKRIKLSNKNVN